MAGSETSRFTVAKSAWLLIELIRIAAVLRSEGLCIGPIRARDLEIVKGGLRRREAESVWTKARQSISGFVHRFVGHEEICHAVGLSRRTLRLLMLGVAGLDGGAFLVEAFDRALEEASRIDGGDGSDLDRFHEILVMYLAMRITVRSPANGVRQQKTALESDQSNSNAVQRSLWIRSRDRLRSCPLRGAA